ncbi:MAG: zinc-dependent alcohol dehydrogenase family protein [Nocardioides sp.]
MDLPVAEDRMRAWVVPVGGPPPLLRAVERPVPLPAPDEVLVRVRVCGVCRTDLHLAEGDLPAKAPEVVPGHEVIGVVVATGAAVVEPAVGDRVGIAWLRRTCLQCHWCRSGAENLCRRSEYTGWDADGGFAEYAVAPAAYTYRLPDGFSDRQAAPLLCAGIIGYRALRRAQVPTGGRLGIYGFGASAHITAQIALAQGVEVHVLTRGAGARALALELGATSAGHAQDRPPVPLDSAIVFAPAGELVALALEALDQNGTLALAGIHLSDIPSLSYARHLFRERTLTSVTANTRADGEVLLRLASTLDLAPRVTPYWFGETNRALEDLRAGAVTGAAVVEVT